MVCLSVRSFVWYTTGVLEGSIYGIFPQFDDGFFAEGVFLHVIKSLSKIYTTSVNIEEKWQH